MDRRRVVAWAGALAALGRVRAAAAQGRPIGRVVAVAGSVVVVRAGGETPLRPDAEVFVGDVLRTGADGRVRFACFGGVIVTVGPESEAAVARLVAAPSTGLSATFRLLAGIVRLVGGAPAGATDLAVETPNALASVRSTDWLVERRGNRTSVFVADGRVEVRGRPGDVAVTLGAGDGTDVVGAQPPRAPVRWGQARVRAALALLEI